MIRTMTRHVAVGETLRGGRQPPQPSNLGYDPPVNARLPPLAGLFALWACSQPGGNLLRHDGPDVWAGEAWTFEDVAPGDPWRQDPGRDARESATGEDLGDAVAPAGDEAGSDAGPPAPVRFVTDGETFLAILDLITGARERLDLVHLEFLDGSLPDQVETALLAAVGRGVAVRVLLERDVDANAARVATLVSGGAEARLDASSRTLHLKLAVADRSRVLVGSTNLSTSSLKYNHEGNWLFTGTPGEAFADYASRLWASDSDLQALTDTGEEDLRLIGDAQYAGIVEPLLDGATRRVLVVQYQVDSKDGDVEGLLQALIAARARGADVRVVLEKSGFSDDLNAANETARQVLVAGGVGVRLDSPDVVTHAKVVVADDWVVVHSGNWVRTGLKKNHEAGAAVRSAEIADEAAAYFEGLWAAASP